MNIVTILRWWKSPAVPISPASRLRGAWVTIAVSSVGWPLSALTFAADEPPWVLGLSWGAIIITAIDVLMTTDVRAEQESE